MCRVNNLCIDLKNTKKMVVDFRRPSRISDSSHQPTICFSPLPQAGFLRSIRRKTTRLRNGFFSATVGLFKSLFTINAILKYDCNIFSFHLFIIYTVHFMLTVQIYLVCRWSVYNLDHFISHTCVTCVNTSFFYLPWVLSIYCFKFFYLFRLTPGPSPNTFHTNHV